MAIQIDGTPNWTESSAVFDKVLVIHFLLYWWEADDIELFIVLGAPHL